jgi:hypothetical protein
MHLTDFLKMKTLAMIINSFQFLRNKSLNFLGHLFLSNNDKDLMLANLYGDFVKGKDLTNY